MQLLGGSRQVCLLYADDDAAKTDDIESSRPRFFPSCSVTRPKGMRKERERISAKSRFESVLGSGTALCCTGTTVAASLNANADSSPKRERELSLSALLFPAVCFLTFSRAICHGHLTARRRKRGPCVLVVTKKCIQQDDQPSGGGHRHHHHHHNWSLHHSFWR